MKNDWILGVSRAETVEQKAAEAKPLDLRLELDEEGKLSLVLDGSSVSEVDLNVFLNVLTKKQIKKPK